jgi:hypothetical protein
MKNSPRQGSKSAPQRLAAGSPAASAFCRQKRICAELHGLPLGIPARVIGIDRW